jgi:hypothetical protein
MYQINQLEQSVFDYPYRMGFRKLKILSGYASSAFLSHILNRYPDLEIGLIVGMAKKDGIKRWDHDRYVQIMNDNPNITISYHRSLPGIHTKIYHWYNDEGMFSDSMTFIGSANFSWNGFRDQSELLAQVDYENVEEVFQVANIILCTDPNVENEIHFYHVTVHRRSRTNDIEIALQDEDIEIANLHHLSYVDLPLLLDHDTAIHERAGLNWGQRPGREPNQAYIPVPTPFNRQHPDFFPPLEQSFTMLTDDGQQLICKMAQANRKAIHTTENNSIMGRYFRNRLSVPLGTRVDAQDIVRYGRTSVRVYKIDNETYFLDFAVTAPATGTRWI